MGTAQAFFTHDIVMMGSGARDGVVFRACMEVLMVKYKEVLMSLGRRRMSQHFKHSHIYSFKHNYKHLYLIHSFITI